MAWSGLGVWLAAQGSFRVLLFHAATYDQLLDVNVAPAVAQKLQSTPPSLPVLMDSVPALFTTERWDAGAVICLERGADLHTAQLIPLPLASVKSRLVLPFWCWLTRVVPGSPGQRAVKWVCLCWFTRQNT